MTTHHEERHVCRCIDFLAVGRLARPIECVVKAFLVVNDDKVEGVAVVIGSRVAALARPSEVLVSQTVKDFVEGSGLSFDDVGEHELKGVPDRWHLYRVVSGQA